MQFSEIQAWPDRLAFLTWPAHAGVILIQLLASASLPLFFLALAAMLFRPSELEFHSIDRFVLALLVLAAGLRAVLLRQRIDLPRGVLVPMAALSGVGLLQLLAHEFDAITWSVLAARFFVPCAMFMIALLTFRSEASLRWLERFLLIVLAYLSLTAIAFLLGWDALIFPPFILDENLGIHADRARGPFLQALANGLSLNLLGLIALDAFRRGRLRGFWAITLLVSLPLAILATKTRAVWLTLAFSFIWMVIRAGDGRQRTATLALACIASVSVPAVFFCGFQDQCFGERLQDEGSIDFRLAAYQAAWGMFLQKPLAGWGITQTQVALADQISDFRGESFAVHNTYLQILVEQGIVGFVFYAWLLWSLFRLGRLEVRARDDLVGSVHALWPILLTVYLVNAMFAVMNYQFVNSLLFTLAGVLAASARTSRLRS
jgi:putative inorganic carbon (HCO3(-)) transporter